MSSSRGRGWQPGRSPVVRGAGRCRRTHFPPASWTAGTAAEAGVQAGAKVPGIGGSPALDAGFPAERCGRPMLPEVRSRVPPSTCRPPTITPESNTCAKICGVVSYERAPKRCPHGPPTGTPPGGRGWTPCTCATALRPSGATGHRTYLCTRLRCGNPRSAPYGATVLRGAVARPDRRRSRRDPAREASEPAGSQTRRPTRIQNI